MLRFLIKLPEHTWGAHDFLDHTNWTNTDLSKARKLKIYKLAEDTWREQREFLDYAYKALDDHPLRDMVKQEYGDLQATKPDLSGYSEAQVNQDYQCPGGPTLRFGLDGSLIRLHDPVREIEWANLQARIGQVTYDTYVEEDFKHMAKLYNYEAGVGYDKPNVTKYAHPEKKRWEFSALNVYKKINSSGCDFWVRTTTKDDQTRTKYGAPQEFYIRYQAKSGQQGLDITVLMMGKVTTRLPESVSFGFTPANPGVYSWSVSKMGQSIDPCNVVLNGSQYVHGVDTGVSLLNQSHGLQILSTDVPVVFIGTTDHIDQPFPVPLQPLNCSTIRTMSYNIYNNIWNTNFIYWYPYNEEDANFKARFTLKFV